MYSIPLQAGLGSELADEVFQHVALKLLESLERIKDAQSLPKWISTCARRESWRLARAERRAAHESVDEQLELEDEALEAHDAALERLEREHALTLALEEIGEPCESLLRALYMEDPPPAYQELAERLGKPVGSLGPTRARCLKKLGGLYERLGGHGP
jgi:RNA polymerase sigma factor (sigma-70 family)